MLATLAVALVAATTALYASTASAQSASDILKQPPFPPTDVSMFDTVEYPDGPAMVPASSGPTDEATLRGLLSNLLNDRFPSSPKTVNQALAVFDSQSAKTVVPDPRLRAALVALKGTTGEPAIAGVLGNFSAVRFGSTDPGAIAQVDAPPPGSDKPIITFNQRYQFEDFRLLAPVMVHEALHQDNNVTNKEELIANSIDTLVYGQFLLESPDLATSGTELARYQNTELMGRINTRDANGNLRLFSPLAPTSFRAATPIRYRTSPRRSSLSVTPPPATRS